MKRGQSGLEFLGTLTILGLLFFVFTLFITNEFSYLLGEPQDARTAKLLADRIAAQVDTAFLAGDGYTSSFFLQDQIGGKDYTITYNATSRIVEVGVISIEEEQLYGTAHYLTTGVAFNNMTNGTIRVRNSAGTVVLWGGAS